MAENIKTALRQEDLLDVLQRSAKQGTLLASCAPEIREFMRQLDTLLSTKKKEWKEKEEAYKMELQSRETELSSMRIALGQKEREAECIHSELRCHQVTKKEYGQQVDNLKEELQRLARKYEQLKSKRKGLTSSSSNKAAKFQMSEVARLKDRCALLELRSQESYAEKTRTMEQLSFFKNEVAALQSKCMRLQESLDVGVQRQSTSVDTYKTNIQQLENQVSELQEVLGRRESLIKALRCEHDELHEKYRMAVSQVDKLTVASHSLQNELDAAQKQFRELQDDLRKKDDSIKAFRASLHQSKELSEEDQLLQEDSRARRLLQSTGNKRNRCRGMSSDSEQKSEELKRLKKKLMAYKQECSQLRSHLSLKDEQLESERRKISQQQDQALLDIRGQLQKFEEKSKLEKQQAEEENRMLKVSVNKKEKELEALNEKMLKLEMQQLSKGNASVLPASEGGRAPPVLTDHKKGGSNTIPHTPEDHRKGVMDSTHLSKDKLSTNKMAAVSLSEEQNEETLLSGKLNDILSKHFSDLKTVLSQ